MNVSAHRAPNPAYRTVLVPINGSHVAEGALPTARALAARFGATVHTVTVSASDFELHRIRAGAAGALGTDVDDPRIHVEVDTDIGRGVHRCAAALDDAVICLSTHAPGRVDGALIGSTARDIVEHGSVPVVVAGPFVVRRDDETSTPPLEVDHLVACVDGTAASELGLPVAAWANALGMKLTLLTVAEPCLPPVRIGARWHRHHGPEEDADEYLRRLDERWALEAPGIDSFVSYDPIGAGSGLKDYIETHSTGLVTVAGRLRGPLARLVVGSGAGEIVHASTAPVLVIPARAVAA